MAFLSPPSSDQYQFFFQNNHHHQAEHHEDYNPDPITSLNIFSSHPPQDHHFHGHHHPHDISSLSMANHHQNQLQLLSPATSSAGYNNNMSNNEHTPNHSGSNNVVNNGDDHDEELSSEDEGSQLKLLGGKKKRLTLEQVRTLEKSFELGNKLEPERKKQLAKALGLHPRQVAIWFQNRRARWKTKQLEKEYNLLKRQFESLKSDNDSLQTQNEKLNSELHALKSGKQQITREFEVINLGEETKSYGWSNNGSEISSSDINLGISTATPPQPATLTELLTKSSPHYIHEQEIQEDGFCSLLGNGDGGQQPPQPFWAWPPPTNQQHHGHLR